MIMTDFTKGLVYGIIVISFGVIGYLVGNSRRQTAIDQRDRLADYIHQYNDMQRNYHHNNTDSVCDIYYAVKAWEREDNRCKDLGFTMDSDSWYYAY